MHLLTVYNSKITAHMLFLTTNLHYGKSVWRRCCVSAWECG